MGSTLPSGAELPQSVERHGAPQASPTPPQPCVERGQHQHEDDRQYDRMRRDEFHASASQVQPNGRRDQHSDDRHGGSGMMRCYLSHASASAAPPDQRDAQHDQRGDERPHAFRMIQHPVHAADPASARWGRAMAPRGQGGG
jgi:hypothetical protein